MKTVECRLGKRTYPVLVGKNVITKIAQHIKKLHITGKVCVITNRTVGKLYYAPVAGELRKAGLHVVRCFVPDSETAKSEKELFNLYEKLIRENFDRSSTIVALGGGVVGDLSGFCAATFMRGIDFINIPTTLLAQVDSAIGGKTGINLKSGKNLVGAFYQPRCVISDVSVLQSLSKKHLVDSLSEVIKYGVIWDKRFFVYLEKNIDAVLQGDLRVLEGIVMVSARIKTKVVERDERETSGLRAILNFGHTFAHAFEAYGSYRKITHGRAVGLGMITATRLAVLCGMLKQPDAIRIESLITRIGVCSSARKYFGKNIQKKKFVDRILYYMQFDKKNKNKKITLILPHSIGTVSVHKGIQKQRIKKAIASLLV